jgi:hypothetical protein
VEYLRIIDRTRSVAPGLRSIEVRLDEATEELPAGVVPWVYRDAVGTEDDPTYRHRIDWMIWTFPPETCCYFTLLSVYHDHDR